MPLSLSAGGSDYTDLTTMLTFSSTSTSQTVTVMTGTDTVIEDEEMFTLSLTSGDIAITLQSSTVSITDQTSKYSHSPIRGVCGSNE